MKLYTRMKTERSQDQRSKNMERGTVINEDCPSITRRTLEVDVYPPAVRFNQIRKLWGRL